jgi:hypothetical protein
MIVVKLIGGLGNQLFQYALGRHLSIMNQTELFLDISGFETYKLHKYSLWPYKIQAELASKHLLAQYKSPPRRLISWFSSLLSQRPKMSRVLEPHFQFTDEILECVGNIYLQGYWQSEKYFAAIRDNLLKELEVSTFQSGRDLEISKQIQAVSSVSLHVRRTDYVTNEMTNSFHGTCDIDYYNRAITAISSMVDDISFFVFSDDPKWAKDNLNISHPVVFVDHNTAERNYEDLRLMSQCRHHIVANSSFSWWGAWLNPKPEKIVFAPKKWFNAVEQNNKDLIPSRWNKI